MLFVVDLFFGENTFISSPIRLLETLTVLMLVRKEPVLVPTVGTGYVISPLVSRVNLYKHDHICLRASCCVNTNN